ncbi:MAG: Sjogren's syndrome/scleroderma autoantigen 1 family protein [Candidatus Nitrosotenuis sp.]
MSQELRKKAVEMLLGGATLLAEPCPYCKGVRVMKDGNALCISCGKEPDKAKAAQEPEKAKEQGGKNPILESMNKKLEQLTAELESEKDHEKQQQILKSINSLIETIQKIKA